LEAQYFIELIAQGKLDNAVIHAQTVLRPLLGQMIFQPDINNNKAARNFSQILGLLAYQDPWKSPIAYLLSQYQREFAADALNNAILSIETGTKVNGSALENLFKQLITTHRVLRHESGDTGEKFILENNI